MSTQFPRSTNCPFGGAVKIRPYHLGAVAMLVASAAEAQQRRITGRVTSEGGEPLSAASVNVIGTTIGAYTTEDGRFSLTLPTTSTVTLRVRRIGYTQRTVTAPVGQDEVTVTLARDVLQLQTQVVTGTVTAVSSENAANAVSVVSSEVLNRVAAPTIDNALQGKVAGAIITQNSGAPGGGTQIQLRGTSTINAAYSPLYVVDGVIVNNSSIQGGLNTITGASRGGSAGNFSSTQDQQVNRIADLNPNDIENIQILKGPSASSIYGSKGTNGVIIITTKQGRAGKTTLDITQRVGQYRLANTMGARCFGSGAEYADWAASILSETSAAARAANVDAYNAAANKCHDYENEFFNNNSLAYQTIAQLRGGTAGGTTYFVSGLAQRDNGLAPNDEYRKQSLRINVGQTLGSRLTLRANTELVHTLTNRGISGNDNTGISPIAIFSSTPSFYNLQRDSSGTFPVNPSGLLPGSNPFQNADIIKTPENVYRLIGSLVGNLSIYSSERQTVDATLTGGVDSYADRARVISPNTGYTEQAARGALAGTLFNSDANFVNANLNGSVVHRFVMPAFTAQTSAGFRQERRESSITQILGRGVIFSSVTSVSQAAQTFPDQTQALVKDFAYFAQEEFFAFDDRLLVTAGVNAERSSNNGNQRKFYAYPKFSASYRVPLLPTMVNDFKLRAAYGRAGNQPTAGRNTFLTPLLYEGTPGARASTIKGAEEIRPELATEIEGGFDLTLFNSRVRFSATQYRKQIDDLLLQAAIAPSTGFTSQWINGGQIVNRGTEVEFDVTAFQSERATWLSTTTFSAQKGKITQLPVPAFNPGVGSFSTSYGNAWIQQGESPTAIQSYNGCSIPLPASGSCPTASKIIALVGDANPDFVMGFNNQVTVGPVRFSGLLEWRKGGDLVNLTNNYYDANDLHADTATSRARYTAWRGGAPVYVEDAGFVKLRELTLGYELPAGLTTRLLNGRAQSARLEVSGRNLYTWTKYSSLDPEVSNFSNTALGRMQDVTPYPPSRSIFFSINTTF
jgi:TonB-linked SusC/RagA family outer membrane protein